jgi:hypothetical protein
MPSNLNVELFFRKSSAILLPGTGVTVGVVLMGGMVEPDGVVVMGVVVAAVLEVQLTLAMVKTKAVAEARKMPVIFSLSHLYFIIFSVSFLNPGNSFFPLTTNITKE